MRVISVVGARGGAGSSTLALEIARALKSAHRTVRLLDSDTIIASDRSDFEALDPEYTVIASCRHQSCEGSDRIILLVPSEVRAIANAVALLPELERHALVFLVVRTPGPTPIRPAKIAELLRLPLAAVIKEDGKVALLGEHGSATTRTFKQSVHHLLDVLELE